MRIARVMEIYMSKEPLGRIGVNYPAVSELASKACSSFRCIQESWESRFAKFSPQQLT